MDCGPACLRMIARFYGKHFNTDTLRNLAGFGKEGVSMSGLSDTAETIGFRSRGVMISTHQLSGVTKPCILHWNQNHFVVLLSVAGRGNTMKFKIADPARGSGIKYNQSEFEKHWISNSDNDEPTGIALLVEPTPAFYEEEGEEEHKLNWKLVLQYLMQSKWQIAQVLATLLIVSLIQLLFPFLTQSIVDNGINVQNLSYVTIIILAQFVLSMSRLIVEFIRSRILLRISNILNLQILSDFWIKLMRLPVSYFDIHHTGDTLQRISDHGQIQNFLTGSALNTLFSVFNFFVYAIVLVMYNVQLFFIFCAGSILYFTWVWLFLKIRRKINYQTFYLSAKENNATLQLIHGMQEIRMNNAEKKMRWDWENIQAAVFNLNFKNLNYSQVQQAGANFINQIQDLAITFIVAKLVIDGYLTIGAMLAVQYVIGQLSGPVNQWVGFIQSAQDARISMERLNEIHQLPDEKKAATDYIRVLPENRSIQIKNLSFTYSSGDDPVLKNINLTIPEKKVTAIVGVSGSGKTTLIKLLLKFTDKYTGEITVGQSESGDGMKNKRNVRFKFIDPDTWRGLCGAVMQDGYIFDGTIADNVAISSETIDYNRLINACQTANIMSFIDTLPNGFNTKLGTEGVGLSQGQKQRLLIARVIYKRPEYIFFDEATNSLDANNEKEIVENLDDFLKDRTAVIVAHRLSTVSNADKIVVLHNGEIAEEGTHKELTNLRGRYYELVKNQLELGR